MSTRRTRKPGKNKYIKVQDIQNTIYESDDDSSNEILLERDRTQAEKDTGNREKNSGIFNECLNLWYGSSYQNNLNNFNSNSKEKNFHFGCLKYNSGEPPSSNQTKDSGSTTVTSTTEIKELISKESKSPFEKLATGETEDVSSSGRKRNSLLQNTLITYPKRVKTELNTKMSDVPAHKPLEIELELERNREPFKRRNINTIIEELDMITRKLKEGYEMCESSTYWGTPIVKQSSEKWDPSYIPQKLLDLYEKRFEMSQPCTSSSALETSSELQTECKPGESKTTRTCPEGVDGEAFAAPEYDNLDEQSVEGTYAPNIQGRMVLRSMTTNRHNYEERISSDISRDNFGTEKHSRKSSSKLIKDKKSGNSKKRAITELERSHDLHSQYLDDDNIDPNTNFEKLKLEDSVPSTSLGAVKPHMEEKAISLPPRIVEEEQVACPICGKNFEKKRIESHANHCATETFRD